MSKLNGNTVKVEENCNSVSLKMYESVLNLSRVKKEEFNVSFESTQFQIKSESVHPTDIIKEEPKSNENELEAVFIKEEIQTQNGVVNSPLSNVDLETTISTQCSESELITTSGLHTQKLLECRYCGLRTNRSSYFEQHMNMHTKKRPFKCNKCNFQTAWKISLKKHMMIHAANEVRLKYNNESYKLQQEHSIQGNRITNYKQLKCDKCSVINGQTHSLCSHTITDSTIDLPFKCEKCSYKTLGKRYLKQHMITHHGEKPFECDICGFKTAWSSNVRQHRKTHTEGKFFMKCSKCSYRTTVKQNYEMHIPLHIE